MEERSTQKIHKVILTDRTSTSLNGILDVLSFDVGEVLLETEQGMLMIKGNDLHVQRLTLDKGEVDIEGRIDSLSYSDVKSVSQSGESFLGRLFK